MRRDDLEDEVREWVDDDVVTESQAEEILSRYPEGGTRSRVVAAVSLVGASLVAVGLLVLVAAAWDELPVAVQMALLTATPPSLLAAGAYLWFERDSERVGHAVVVLGTLSIGASLYLAEEVLFLGFADETLLLPWALLALPVAYAVGSRAVALVGLGVFGVWLSFDFADASATTMTLYGVVLYSVADPHDSWRPDVGFGGVHRALGSLFALAGAYVVVLQRADGDVVGLGTPAAVVFVPAVCASVYLVYRAAGSRTARSRHLAVWASLALAFVAVAAASVEHDVVLPVLHVVFLALSLETVVAGYHAGERRTVDVGILAFVFYLGYVYFTTVWEAVPRSLALVAGGVLLLAGGYFLERKRSDFVESLDDGTDRDSEEVDEG
ncbi:MAG: DUF2157 domain-containing protein [Halobacteriales archaeon]